MTLGGLQNKPLNIKIINVNVKIYLKLTKIVGREQDAYEVKVKSYLKKNVRSAQFLFIFSDFGSIMLAYGGKHV